jgi:ketosteroid isomerase-like protein
MSKRQRRAVLLSSPLVMLIVLLVWGKIAIDRLEANAQLLAQTGQAAIKLLNEFRSGVDDFVATKDAGKIFECYAENYFSDHEGEWKEILESNRDGVEVYEWKVENPRAFHKADVTGQFTRYLESITSIEESKFKLDSVEETLSPDLAVVRGVLWLRGKRKAQSPGKEEAFESHALIRLWLQKHDGEWKVTRQELIHGETVTGDRRGFTDITDSAGIDFISTQNPLFATPAWQPKMFGILKYGPAGVSAVDYDNDGWYDVFFGDGGHPRLYHNKGDGTFEEVTVAAGLPDSTPGINVGIFADFDNDGFKDLFLGRYTGYSRLFRNVADPQVPKKRKFVEVTDSLGLPNKGDSDFIVVAAAGDYNNDGYLDLYVGRELDARKNLPTTLFYTRNAEGNTLLRNDGNFHFTDVTSAAGINETGITLGVAWGDYDNDGWQDIYVANDFGRDALLHNNGNGTFSDLSKESGAFDPGYGMSATWADINNDGNLDIYVSDVHSGQRWYGQAATLYQYLLTSVRQGTIYEDLPVYTEIYKTVGGTDWSSYGDKTVKGNALYLNDGHGKFKDVSEAARANPFGWYWSSTVFDYDNDGRQDVYAVNGWISGKKKDDL